MWCIAFAYEIFTVCDNCYPSAAERIEFGHKLKVMTFNMGKHNIGNIQRNFLSFAEFLNREELDIIVLQEIKSDLIQEINYLKTLYPYSSDFGGSFSTSDSLIMSAYPLH